MDLAVQNQEKLFQNVTNISGTCRIVASSVIEALGLKLDAPLPHDLNDLSRVLKNVLQPSPMFLSPSSTITDLSDQTEVLSNLMGSVSKLASECCDLKNNLEEFSGKVDR